MQIVEEQQIMECVRRSVPNDNSCLFSAVAYLVDGPDAVSDATQTELRRVCAESVFQYEGAPPRTRTSIPREGHWKTRC